MSRVFRPGSCPVCGTTDHWTTKRVLHNRDRRKVDNLEQASGAADSLDMGFQVSSRHGLQEVADRFEGEVVGIVHGYGDLEFSSCEENPSDDGKEPEDDGRDDWATGAGDNDDDTPFGP